MPNDELKLLINIAQLYYEDNLTQAEISAKLGIYRTTISRLLKKAQQQQVITFKINYTLCQTSLLEKQLKEHFKLHEVIIVDTQKDEDLDIKLQKMGYAGATYLQKIITNQDIIGFSWGSSLAAVANQLDSSIHKDALCVPMVGGPAGKLISQFHVNTIVYNIATKLHSRSLLMDFPAILEEKSLRDAIVKSQHYNQIVAYWPKLTIAMFGIGSCNISNSSIWHGFYGDDDQIETLENKPIAGDICSRFFDHQGDSVQTNISDKIINITLDQLKMAKYRIGIAQSSEKVDAIIAAISAGYINVLITTKGTAQSILTQLIPPD
ncbi:sugar-binding transcriptional regulator [Orbus wheelerorum]|uniref:sugar-binding transcriptional regulator n=1 Tax=Orbus wheelerorum TaxID=3074111 RepID=UPI00370D0BE1